MPRAIPKCSMKIITIVGVIITVIVIIVVIAVTGRCAFYTAAASRGHNVLR